MKKQNLFAAVSMIALISAASISALNAAETSKAVFESCVALLPHGHKFEFNMQGNIDTTVTAPKFEGGFGLSDGSKKDNAALQEQVLPFVECVKSQMKQ